MTDGMLFTGKTVEDAVAEGLRTLQLAQDQVTIEVLSRGSRGLFGIGSEPAQVRLTPRPPQTAPPSTPSPSMRQPLPPTPSSTEAAAETPAGQEEAPLLPPTAPAGSSASVPAAIDSARLDSAALESSKETGEDTGEEGADEGLDDPETSDLETSDPETSDPETGDPETSADEEEMAALAVELLAETVRHMGFDAEVEASWQEPDTDNDERYLLLNLEGRDLGALIGRRGDTLNNLQYLLRLMVNQRLHQWKNIVVDVEQYRQRRAEHLVQFALRSAGQVADTGRPLSLEPMPPNERRIIHLALRDHPSVFTESSGEGERRKIQILPKRT